MRTACVAVALGLGVATLGLGPGASQGAEMAFDFRGTLTATDGIDGIHAGDAFTGVVRFDPANFQLVPMPPGYEDVTNVAGYDGPVVLDVTIGSQTFRIGGDDSEVGVINNEPLASWGDNFLVSRRDLSAPDSMSMILSFLDPSGLALQSTALPTPFDPAAFSQITIEMWEAGTYRGFSGVVDPITPASVPEPSTLWLVGLVALGAVARRRLGSGLLRSGGGDRPVR